MTALNVNRAAPLGSVTAFGFVALLERVVDAFVAWRSARSTEKVLRELSDKQLADIGLHRGDITALAEDLSRR
jgi:uncharacterized protein YjiS (DUF1127 family)